MMLPLLSPESSCKTLLWSEYMVDGRKYDTSYFAVALDIIRPSTYSGDSKDGRCSTGSIFFYFTRHIHVVRN